MQPESRDSYPNAIRLDGRGFVVLGAGGGGMGTQTSIALAEAGAALLCVDAQADQAHDIAAATGGVAHVADVTSREDMQAVFDRASTLFENRFAGVVDIVGVAKIGQISEFDDNAITRQFDIVLRHALLATQIATPMLAANGGGSMVFIGSISGLTSVLNQAVYGMAKAALHHLVRQSAIEYGPAGVRFNAIAPGFVKTPRLAAAISPEDWKSIAEGIPLRRVASPSDIARAALFLASDQASYVTGNVLVLDGGLTGFVSPPEIKV
jgi:NAD(P)-dependent dehydrogenase (short-subunit alcohol dehydrogenase family)